jgi:hypothetical protein
MVGGVVILPSMSHLVLNHCHHHHAAYNERKASSVNVFGAELKGQLHLPINAYISCPHIRGSGLVWVFAEFGVVCCSVSLAMQPC